METELLYLDILGKPFERDGRGPSTYDCVGLMIEVLRRLGKQIADPMAIYNPQRNADPLDVDLFASQFEEVEPPYKPGDVFLLKLKSSIDHVAVYIGRGYVLEARREAGVVSVRAATIAQNVEKVLRYVDDPNR